jgi:hypothetical protein
LFVNTETSTLGISTSRVIAATLGGMLYWLVGLLLLALSFAIRR